MPKIRDEDERKLGYLKRQGRGMIEESGKIDVEYGRVVRTPLHEKPCVARKIIRGSKFPR